MNSMNDMLRKILKTKSKTISVNDLGKIIKNKDRIEKRFSADRPLERYIDIFKLLYSIIKDYSAGEYRKIPWWTIASIGVALLYVLNPFDLIPDMLPVIGLIDDASMIGICLLLIEKDLNIYKSWKMKRDKVSSRKFSISL
jgi:uncharacterized membrane protein YkvA (DUF1232 family)